MNYMLALKKKENNREIGSRYETVALRHLEDKGHQLIAKNYRCRLGEIDLITQDGAYTVFIEVKYRKSIGCGYPRESVGYKKQRRIGLVASYYLQQHHLYDTKCRFDVVEIIGEQIHHLYNAF